MDLDKIFLKDSCPTSIGGQAVMEGLMMKGPDRTALALRLPNDEIYLKTMENRKPSPLSKVFLIRGIMAFFYSLLDGTRILLIAAGILEQYMEEAEQPGKLEKFLNEKFGEKAVWNIMIGFSVVAAIVLSVGMFILLPTAVVGILNGYINNGGILAVVEGVIRMTLFIGYIVLIANMEDIKKTFQYHGAEHKTIHCFEKNLPLTPENAQSFYTLHPRCGTSFLMFVMIITVITFPLLGWQSLVLRLISRIIIIPIIAGISYELLKIAGRSDSTIIKILSMPGIYLQKLTTKEPTLAQLEVAIVALEAVLVDAEEPMVDGIYEKRKETEYDTTR